MVHNNGMKIQMPQMHQNFGGPAFDNGQMRNQLERMEQQLNEMQKRLGGPNQPADNNSNDQDSNK
jgi:hypothetical protein